MPPGDPASQGARDLWVLGFMPDGWVEGSQTWASRPVGTHGVGGADG